MSSSGSGNNGGRGVSSFKDQMKQSFGKRKQERIEEDKIPNEPGSKKVRQTDPRYAARIEHLLTQELAYDPTSSRGAMSVLGRQHGTDKIHQHGYHRYYPRYLESYRFLPSTYAMLEIGIDQSASLHTWLDYFPEAHIYGVDIGVSKTGDRFSIFQCDQSKLDQLERLTFEHIDCTARQIFFILDDGSHIPEHQVLSFNYLFQFLLMPGGTYIIEDIETSYWKRGGLYNYPTQYGYHHEKNIIQVFKHLLDEINREFLSEEARATQATVLEKYGIDAETRKWICSITFGQNCIVITKKTKEELQFHDRTYRFDKYV